MDSISIKNSDYWNEMCGTTLAKNLGIKGITTFDLEKFDNYYFKIYPYLKSYFSLDELKKSKVAEFGLGYGTLSEFLAKNSKDYTGVDIAVGPVDMVNHRLKQRGLEYNSKAILGNALSMPFENESFDCVIAIGCFHHTGNFSKCIEETFRVLRPGGSAIIMVYNRYSYKRWLRWPLKNFLHFFLKKSIAVGKDERAAFDRDTKRGAPPETQFFSVDEVFKDADKFSKVIIKKENLGGPFRLLLLKTLPWFVNLFGLDLYIKLVK